MPKLKKRLLPDTQRIFPTAVRLVLHAQLLRHPTTRLPRTMDTFCAYDAQDRALLPLRPTELPELQRAIREAHGGGFLRLDLSA